MIEIFTDSNQLAISNSLAMGLVFAVIVLTMVFYAMELAAIELVSLGAIVALMLVGALLPASGIEPGELLRGFSNPALITILALLVIGQGLIQTEAMASLAEYLGNLWPKYPILVVIFLLIIAGAASSIVNNTPVVVVFIPVLASILKRRKISSAKYMMPLSYITILGGMMTLLGSSTNLLAAGAAREAGVEIGFFSFAVPGLAMALVGGIYVLFIAPLFVPDNQKDTPSKNPSRSTQFLTEIRLTPGHPLIGDRTVAGMFPNLTSFTVRSVRRGLEDFLPPFDDIVLRTGDTLIIAATRNALTDALKSWRAFEHNGDATPAIAEGEGAILLYEALVPPGSRMVNNVVDQAGFAALHECTILGIERRSRMPRQTLSQIRIEAGDVLLISGQRSAISRLRGLRDLLVMEWSGTEVQPHGMALKAQIIFIATIAVIASGVVPMVVAAVAGAFLMIGGGCLNVRQAARAIDRKIVMLVASSIAMAFAMSATGGADFIAQSAINSLAGVSPGMFMAGLFLLVAVLTNFMSNNATAILFTPIAIAAAAEIGMDPLPLIVSVILGANASFATPIGYQTNLLVMGAGHYRFRDFIMVGSPLVIIVWIVFSIVAPWYYGVPF
ncbi:MAG: SLC13 family permease [Devosiaceae bacterium]|nr:SLC13 family permease [Devosiaceae bacterium]